MQEVDYLIVGGGTAGAILARRLADAGAGSVALLEAGPSDEGDDRVLELRRCIEVMDSELDWDYRVVPQARGNGQVVWNRARVLGGCSSHNAGIAFKTPDHDLRIWESRGAAGWGPDDVAACFDRIWSQLPCEYGHTDNDWEQTAVTAATQWGVPRVEFGRVDHAEGTGFVLLHKQGIYRTSSSISYLHPLDRLPDTLSVVVDCEASRLVWDEHDPLRVVGVDTDQGRFTARREVIVCGGVVNTPKLLLLSGLGPAAHLRDVGIPIRVDLPVGEHLSDHPETVLMWESTRRVPLESAQDWECTALVKSDPALEVGDLIVNFGPIPYDLYTVPYGCPTLPPGQAFSIAPYVGRPRSEGTVRLASADPAAKPLIDPATHTDEHDTRTLLRGLRIAREIVQQPALRDWVARELAPGPDAQGDDELMAYIRATGNTTYHPVGSCRMGAADDPDAVVGPDLRVRGVQGLRIADASVFPTHVGVNPVITVMMVGERAADLVLGRPAVRGAAVAAERMDA